MQNVVRISEHPRYRICARLSDQIKLNEAIGKYAEKIECRDRSITELVDQCVARLENHNDQEFKTTREAYDDMTHRVNYTIEALLQIANCLISYDVREVGLGI